MESLYQCDDSKLTSKDLEMLATLTEGPNDIVLTDLADSLGEHEQVVVPYMSNHLEECANCYHRYEEARYNNKSEVRGIVSQPPNKIWETLKSKLTSDGIIY